MLDFVVERFGDLALTRFTIADDAVDALIKSIETCCLRQPGGASVFVEANERFNVTPSVGLQQEADTLFGDDTYYVKVDEFGHNAKIPLYTLSVTATAAAPDLAAAVTSGSPGALGGALPPTRPPHPTPHRHL